MAYSAWSVIAGEQPTTSKWNILGTNDATFNTNFVGPGTINSSALNNQYKFSVYRNAAYNTSVSAIAIPYDTKLFDTGTNVDVVTNKGRFTAPIAGFYFFTAAILVAATSGDHYTLAIAKNGSEFERGLELSASQTTNYTLSTNAFLQLAANDFVEGFFGGAVRAITTGSTFVWFTGFLVSAT
jgi:hypothetical protein